MYFQMFRQLSIFVHDLTNNHQYKNAMDLVKENAALILEEKDLNVGLIGSIAVYINGEKIEDTDRTTPESIEIQKYLANIKISFFSLQMKDFDLKI